MELYIIVTMVVWLLFTQKYLKCSYLPWESYKANFSVRRDLSNLSIQTQSYPHPLAAFNIRFPKGKTATFLKSIRLCHISLSD